MSKDIGGNVLLSQADFPNLHPGNHQVSSPASGRYNCIAWAAGSTHQWWDPAEPEEGEDNFYWPENVPRDYKLSSLIAAYETVGYVLASDGALEDGFEKIALYADSDEYMHAARQLETGKWTSKIGYDEDIEHDTPNNVAGPAYGQVAAFMRRARTPDKDPA